MIVNSAISSPYFYNVLNLIGSIQKNSPCVSRVDVWDIGLTDLEKALLGMLNGVRVITVPEFCSHWRHGYSWKIYLYSKCDEAVVFNIDAKSEVLKDLDVVERTILADGIFLISQGHPIDLQTPDEYWDLFGVDRMEFAKDTTFHAGILGYHKGSKYREFIEYTFEMMLLGYNLGFSESERHRHKDLEGDVYLKSCELFRQDQTLLNLSYRKFFGKPVLHETERFAKAFGPPDSNTVIFNHRSNRLAFIKYLRCKNWGSGFVFFAMLPFVHPIQLLRFLKARILKLASR